LHYIKADSTLELTKQKEMVMNAKKNVFLPITVEVRRDLKKIAQARGLKLYYLVDSLLTDAIRREFKKLEIENKAVE
jgi:hypothetical protein